MADSKKRSATHSHLDESDTTDAGEVDREKEPARSGSRKPPLPTELTVQAHTDPPSAPASVPLAAWFLGPKAEHGETWERLISYVFQDYIHWRRNYFPGDPVVISRTELRRHEEWLDLLSGDLDLILNELKAHFPFYHATQWTPRD